MSIALQPTPDHQAGHAELRIAPWITGLENVELCIQRNQGDPFMTTTGAWSTQQQWLQVSGARQSDGALVLDVGPQVVDAVLLSSYKVFRCIVRVGGNQIMQQPLSVASTLLPSSAKGNAPPAVGQGTIASVPVVPKPPVPELVAPVVIEPAIVAAVPVSGTQAPAGKPWGKIIAVVVILIVLTVAAYFSWAHFSTKTPDPAAALSPPVASLASGCTAENIAKPDELAFVQQCIRDVQDPAALLAIITAAKESLNCGVAQRLYANRAQSGNTVIALAYAREYDPKFYKANKCFAQADAATATYWYEAVLARDTNNAEARDRVQELQK